MRSRREVLLLLGCALSALLLAFAVVALRDVTCRVPGICLVNPRDTGPYCLPVAPECGTFVRDNILIVASTTVAGLLVGLGLVAWSRRRADRGRCRYSPASRSPRA